MNMEQHKFSDIQLSDPFFDSLKNDYPGFSDWYAKKAETGSKALIQKNELGLLQAFLYLKKEDIKSSLKIHPHFHVLWFYACL